MQAFLSTTIYPLPVMRILIISIFFPPLNSIASLRPYSWAKYWTLLGHDVTVLTAAKDPDSPQALSLSNPGYSVIEVEEHALLRWMRKTYSKPISAPLAVKKTITAASSGQAPSNGFKQTCRRWCEKIRQDKGVFNACRMPDLTDLWIKPALKSVEKKGDWDFIISTAGPYSVHLAAHALKKRGRSKIWASDYRDTWSDGLIYPGLFPFNWIEKKLEQRILKLADLITTVSEPFTRLYQAKHPDKKVLTIENGFDPSDLESITSRPLFPDDGKLRIIHTGSIYAGRRDPSPLFAAIRSIAQSNHAKFLLDNLEVLFVGLKQAGIDELIRSYGVESWVKIHPFVKREEALKMQRDAHWLLFLPWNDTSVDGILTGKIFEYLYSGTPIIAVGGNGLEASQKLILEAKAGRILNSAEEIEAFLIEALTKNCKEQSLINPAVLQRYDRKALAEKLLYFVESKL